MLVDEFGVRTGDRVAIAMRNVPEWSVAFFAAVLAGAIATPLNAFWTGGELAFALEDAEPRVVIADGERFERLTESLAALRGVALLGTRLDDRKTDVPLPSGIAALDALLEGEADPLDVEIDPDDLATIFYTSGTTSHPKGVLGTHRNMCTNVVSSQFVAARGARRAGLAPSGTPTPRSVVLVPVPLFHGTGCHSGLVAQVWSGGTVVLMRKWDPESALDLIEREHVTSMTAVPTMVWDLVNSPTVARHATSASLRGLGGGGAAAPPELVRRLREVLPGRGAGYGVRDDGVVVAHELDRRGRLRGAPQSVGVPVPIVDVRLVDEDGNEVPVGEVGEILIKGPTVVAGYWRRPEDTAATFADGWLRSGDLGRFDDEGFLYIVDRAKDMVIRGGENISSIEVEAALFDHPERAGSRGVRRAPPGARGGGRCGRPAAARRERVGRRQLRRARGGHPRPVQGAGPHLAPRRTVPTRRDRQDPEARAEGDLHVTASRPLTCEEARIFRLRGGHTARHQRVPGAASGRSRTGASGETRTPTPFGTRT